MVDNAHRPARNTRRDTTVIVCSIDYEFPLAAENPVSPVMVLDSEVLAEPSFARENNDYCYRTFIDLVSVAYSNGIFPAFMLSLLLGIPEDFLALYS